MKMRVSIARALSVAPDILLLDEPFGSLDEMTRDRLNEDLLAIRERDPFTACFVTHSVAEALFLSTPDQSSLAPIPGASPGWSTVPFAYPRPPELREDRDFPEIAGRRSRTTCAQTKSHEKARHLGWILPLLAGLLIIAVWYAVKAAFSIESFILPSPDEIVRAGWQERHSLLSAVLLTGRGALLGFIAAVGGGFLISLAIGFSLRLKQAFYPYILILQMTPVIILAPIFVLWLGQGLPAIVAITFMICFFPVVANTTMGFISVDPGLLELFAMSRASRWQEFRYLRIPSALPYFLTGMKIAGTLAPIGAITGDFLAGGKQNGVGWHRIHDHRLLFP